MSETEIQDVVGNLGQIIAQHAIDLALARATISKLEKELTELRSAAEAE